MLMRIWRDCTIIAEIWFSDDPVIQSPGRVVWYPDSEDAPIIGDHDHVSIDPWNKLAGEQLGGIHHSVSIALPGGDCHAGAAT